MMSLMDKNQRSNHLLRNRADVEDGSNRLKNA